MGYSNGFITSGHLQRSHIIMKFQCSLKSFWKLLLLMTIFRFMRLLMK